MKKKFVLVLVVFLGILGCLSGYLAYKNSFHNLILAKEGIQKTPNTTSSFSSYDNPDFLNNRDFGENFIDDKQVDFQKSTPSNTLEISKKTQDFILPVSTKKPKMAIIMDDMAYPSQLQSLHHLGLKITPSFFPYNLDNKLTPKMASKETFYMVHLPLEALHFYQSPHRWIKVGEKKSHIEEYIKQIKHDFPKLQFINNHTGSKFTASYEDMKNLIDILRKYDIDFLDSRTTIQTKAPQIYAEIKRPLLSRKIFLDNKDSVSDIVIQIKKAIKKAKKDGYVIAICHPHKNTFRALEISKQNLLQEVDLVYIKDIQKMLFDEK
ncbi:divergent polysaccharide deacetylase family protein [Helicobacter cappadocius]|uniref:Divergent polysaccharide deacetylase family protein n=1 Tax=Helicobacter cappadocius TaxID=3063998 RepID=A0AA90Q176_9HELI|nr:MULTISPECIES: divergent polysaccharide deacetylase family protein [unclassified Helicobacter]MDO7252391.1 divergent polysaccharide deacetylase family protein [Helicobacter sp. faydin-H75]MDP2538258.1 divergent polysaccharide deacetylase family protein [Helicobacter sp. faydin-H76]